MVNEVEGIADSGRSRIATRADLDALFMCDPHAAGSEVERRAQIESAVDRSQCIVWETDSQVVGFIVTLPRYFYGRDFVDLFVVLESYRRRGIGRSLMRAAVDSVALTEVWTSTNESNFAMRELLASEGWQLSGTLRGLDEGDAELVFYFGRMDV